MRRGRWQRNTIAEATLNHKISEFNRHIKTLRISEFRAIKQRIRPLVGRWQVVAGKRIDVRGRTELRGCFYRGHITAPR